MEKRGIYDIIARRQSDRNYDIARPVEREKSAESLKPPASPPPPATPSHGISL